ncbi:MAG TPA: homoserine O-succinyltransferase [Treponemataceae bacterium]|nr:homoserine O-succinyltransferase [Treponemataceae bacterium]
MPIKISSELPAVSILENENIFVMTDKRAVTQDIRPLKIAIVNLMPTKIATETHLLRLLANTPLQVEIFLVRMMSHESKNTGREHLERFYITTEEALSRKFDGMIITGAPVEKLSFDQVDYWKELTHIMNYAHKNSFCTLYICWGAQAGLYHHYGVKKNALDEKLFGVFENKRTTHAEPLLRGFDDVFNVPQSRYTEVHKNDILARKDLTILAESDESGVLLVKSNDNRQVFMTGHLEYDADTLSNEYWRDKKKGLDIQIPYKYYPNDNPNKAPLCTWRSYAHLFYANWLNYYVYQETPFDFI